MSPHCRFRREAFAFAIVAGALMFASPGMAQQGTAGPRAATTGLLRSATQSRPRRAISTSCCECPSRQRSRARCHRHPARPSDPGRGCRRGTARDESIQRLQLRRLSHGKRAGGGMGPALSQRAFTYGSEPANIYLTIIQGRPNGMPAWGSVSCPTRSCGIS